MDNHNDKPAVHSFKVGDRVRIVRFVRGLPSAVVGTIGIVTDVSSSAAKVAFVDPDVGSRSVTFVLGDNLNAIERIDAAPVPAPSATVPAPAPIHDGSLGYTRAAWEEREAVHAREMAALRMRLDTETERANRLADECGALADRLKAESRSNDLLTGRNSRLTSERGRARNELARREPR